MNFDWTHISDFIGLKSIIPLVLTAFSAAWVTRFFDKKKYTAEAHAIEQENIKTMFEIYQSSLKDIQNRLGEYQASDREHIKNKERMDKRVTKLEIEVAKLSAKICTVKKCPDRMFLDIERDKELVSDENDIEDEGIK